MSNEGSKYLRKIYIPEKGVKEVLKWSIGPLINQQTFIADLANLFYMSVWPSKGQCTILRILSLLLSKVNLSKKQLFQVKMDYFPSFLDCSSKAFLKAYTFLENDQKKGKEIYFYPILLRYILSKFNIPKR